MIWLPKGFFVRLSVDDRLCKLRHCPLLTLFLLDQDEQNCVTSVFLLVFSPVPHCFLCCTFISNVWQFVSVWTSLVWFLDVRRLLKICTAETSLLDKLFVLALIFNSLGRNVAILKTRGKTCSSLPSMSYKLDDATSEPCGYLKIKQTNQKYPVSLAVTINDLFASCS